MADGVEIVWHEGMKDGGGAVEIATHGEKVRLDLEPAGPLLDPHFAVISRRNDSSELLPHSLVRPSCFYTSRGPFRAALNLCNGMVSLYDL